MKMHRLPFLLLLALVGLVSFASCGEDEEVQDSLSYDGPNVTAPNQPQGTTVFAAFFPESETRRFEGRTLESLRFWIERVPDRTAVVIYEAGTSSAAPGDEIYRRDITQRVNVPLNWVTHNIAESITIPAGGIWLGVEVALPSFTQSVGCDAGTNYSPNGDRLRTPDGTWTNFRDITGGESVNWNIRGFLAEE